MKHTTDSRLDIMILLYIREVLKSVLITCFSLCRFHKYFLPYVVEISLKLSLSRNFFLQGEERDE